MDVASIRSAILHLASRNLPTPLQRAQATAVAGKSTTAQSFLNASAGVAAQIIVSRLDGDISSATTNPAQVQAAYSATVAFIRDAQARDQAVVNLIA